jgi:hypothetical protein
LAQPADSAKKRPLSALAITATAAHDAGGPFSLGFRDYAGAGMKKEELLFPIWFTFERVQRKDSN